MNQFDQFVTEMHKKMKMITLDLSVMENAVNKSYNHNSIADINGAKNIRRIYA